MFLLFTASNGDAKGKVGEFINAISHPRRYNRRRLLPPPLRQSVGRNVPGIMRSH